MDPERAHALLLRERERISSSLASLERSETDEPAVTDPADRASDTYEAELNEGLADGLRTELAAVERAEVRLAAGTYGLSIESGAPIPDERLELIPTAERTAEEQDRFDRNA
jgi:DnaK suppressor protein